MKSDGLWKSRLFRKEDTTYRIISNAFSRFIIIIINKNTVQIIQNTVNTGTHITKTTKITKPTRTHTHTLQNKLKQAQCKLKRPQYKISK